MFLKRSFIGVSILTLVCDSSLGELTGPYSVDAYTRHLWHFDESVGSAAPAVGVSNSFNLLPSDGATLGAAGFLGFSSAGDCSAETASGFQGSAISVGDVTDAAGAFTFEAMVSISEISSIQQIVSMENSGSLSERPFQFRIEGGELKLIRIAGGLQTITAPIPVTGSDAFVPHVWFHVAVTYNGLGDTADNIKLYWTRVESTRIEANEILSSSLEFDLEGVTTVLGVGNEYRNSQDNHLTGLIDEVRISTVVRGPDAFLFSGPDTDNDGLTDSWELLHFRASQSESDAILLAKYDGEDDPDGDTFSNEAEESAGTSPLRSSHTPLDVDRDGFLDAWEVAAFGSIGYGPADDPDGDGWSTEAELAAGTDPTDLLSNPADTDADGIEDTIELAFFGDLSQGEFDDYDGDGISNGVELEAGTSPADGSDSPDVSLLPLTDGNQLTDENGYAGSSINSVAFLQNSLVTVGEQQFIAYYRRHATDANEATNNTIIIARRDLGQSQWEFFATDFVSFNINDTHNVVCIAIDGDGFLHMSWGMHNDPLLYAKSTTSVLGTASIVMTSLGTAGMTGQENTITYPKFQNLPDGDLLFFFREGSSGRGDWYLNRYDTDSDSWTPVHSDSNGVSQPLFRGTGDSPDNCFYSDRMTIGPNNFLHFSGVFRFNGDSPSGESGYQTNHRYVYLRSPDGGTTWQRLDGSVIDLPVVEDASFQNLGLNHVPEIIEDMPEGSSIINQAGMTTDSAGRPIIASWWADGAQTGDHTRQYHILFHNGSTWQQRAVSARDLDDPNQKFAENQLGSSGMGRPVVITDSKDRIIVIYNDNRFEGITLVFSKPLLEDPSRSDWTRMSLTSKNEIGGWEATYDEVRWKRDGILNMLYQPLPGRGESYGGQNNSTLVSVLHWDAKAYLNGPVQWNFDTETTLGTATIASRTRIGFRDSLRTSTDLNFDAPPVSSRLGDGSWQDLGSWFTNEPKRFWFIERSEESLNNL